MKINWKKLIVIILLTFLIGTFFSWFIIKNFNSFENLNKPFNIPSFIFPLVWTILYFLMGISYYLIDTNSSDNKDEKYIYWLQLIINSIWPLLFFGFDLLLLSFIWIIILIIMVLIMIIKFYKINKTASLIQIPYLLWIIFAAYLNFSIYILN